MSAVFDSIAGARRCPSVNPAAFCSIEECGTPIGSASQVAARPIEAPSLQPDLSWWPLVDRVGGRVYGVRCCAYRVKGPDHVGLAGSVRGLVALVDDGGSVLQTVEPNQTTNRRSINPRLANQIANSIERPSGLNRDGWTGPSGTLSRGYGSKACASAERSCA